MSQKIKVLLGAAAFVLLIAISVAAYNILGDRAKPDGDIAVVADPGNASGSAADNPKAPDFTMTDPEGNSVKLSDVLSNGKPVVLNFWASWCPPCKTEMPDFEKVYKELGGDVQFIMLNMTDGERETKETGEKFIGEQGYTFPVFFDTELEGASAYGIRFIPTTVFISKDGYVAAGTQGTTDEQTLRKGIDLIK